MINKAQAMLFKSYCASEGLPEPVPEYEFAKEHKRRWRIDYYFKDEGRQVALEVEGGVWLGGRHNRPRGFIKDIEKYNALSQMGIYLIRVTPNDLFTLATIKLIKNTLYNLNPEL